MKDERNEQHGSRCERHRPDDDWHEWSVGIGDGIEVNKPARLFVRYDGQCLIEITEANVTSWNAEARQLEGSGRALHLTTDAATFLLEALPKALKLAGMEHEAERDAELQRWIPVAESQPRPLDACIGYDEFYGRIGEASYTGRKDDFGEPRFTFVDSDDCHITHWMPMPSNKPKVSK